MNRLIPTVSLAALLLLAAAGCASHDEEKAPLLAVRNQLSPNVGSKVRIEGTARYIGSWGPSVATDSFELWVYGPKVWGAEAAGRQVEVTGVLRGKERDVVPAGDPGNYWMTDVTWKFSDAANPK